MVKKYAGTCDYPSCTNDSSELDLLTKVEACPSHIDWLYKVFIAKNKSAAKEPNVSNPQGPKQILDLRH